MIYDCFTFFNELDLLEIRLNILNDVVDKFVIVESRKTHTNLDKPLILKENMARFEKFKDKIIYVEWKDFPRFETTWTYENYQRNAIKDGLKDCNDDDIIIISDLDEIPKPEKILEAIKLPGIKSLDMQFYSKYINHLHSIESNWTSGSRILTYKDFLTYFDINESPYSHYCPKRYNEGTTATKIRMYKGTKSISDAGWHFSSIGSLENIISKFKSRAHIKQTKDMSESELLDYVENMKKSCQTSEDTLLVPIEEMPKFLQDNYEKYKPLFIELTEKNGQKYYSLKRKYQLKKFFLAFLGLFFKAEKQEICYKIKALFINFEIPRKSTKKLLKKFNELTEQLKNDINFKQNAEDTFEMFNQEDFEEKLSFIKKKMDEPSQKRLDELLDLVLKYKQNSSNTIVNLTDYHEKDIYDEYAQHNHVNDGTNNFKGFNFIDEKYEPCHFLYEIGLIGFKEHSEFKNILEIGAEYGDSSMILSQKVSEKLYLLNPEKLAKDNLALNKIQNIEYIENTDNISNIDLIRIDTKNQKLDNDFYNLVQKFNPNLLIEIEENLKTLYDILSKLKNLGIEYNYSLIKSNPKNLTGELVLICEKAN